MSTKPWEVHEVLLGTRVSAQTVSRAVAELTPLVESFHRRGLEDNYRFLFLDGVTQSVRKAGRENRQGITGTAIPMQNAVLRV